MKKIALLLSVFLLVFTGFIYTQERGDLIDVDLEKTLSITDIIDIYEDFNLPPDLIPIEFTEVEVYKITYFTLDGRGEQLVGATGLLTLPVETSCDYPMLTYCHGTLMYDEVLSDFEAKQDQHHVGVPFAANGYVVVLPDFLGYGGAAVHPHPYMHAKSEATATIDMMRAAEKFCFLKGTLLNGQNFLLGYSQGGHVAMATHKEIEENYADEFTVTASAPCSGPYDLSGIMRDSMLTQSDFSNPFYIAFTTVSYQYVYQNIYQEIIEVFKQPFADWITKMLDQENPESDLRDSLPYPGVQMFQDDFLNAVIEDDLHPFNQNILENDVYEWAPEAPVGLFYCTADEKVPFENATKAAETMNALGADVVTFDMGPFSHSGCTFFSIIGARNWFENYREPCSAGYVGENYTEDLEVQISPNPNQGIFSVKMPERSSGEIIMQAFNTIGQPVFYKNIPAYFVSDYLQVELKGQHAGMYFLKVSDGEEFGTVRVVVK